MLDLHIETVCEELSPMEYDIALQYLGITKILLFTLWKHQMGETRRCPIYLCECISDVSQHLVIHSHFSASASELELQGSTSLVVTQNHSTYVCFQFIRIGFRSKKPGRSQDIFE